MAEATSVALQPTLQSFFLAQTQRNSGSDLAAAPDYYGPMMERGPRYEAYAQLRESKLRLKFFTQQLQQQELDRPEPDRKVVTPPPPTKLVRFLSSSEERNSTASRSSGGGRRGCSVLAQSVPDFSAAAAALRKENRKPVSTTPTLPLPAAANSLSRSTSLKGSKSANNAGEKRGGGVLMARKSYAAMDELRNFSSAVGNAVTGEGRGVGGGRKTVLSCRKF